LSCDTVCYEATRAGRGQLQVQCIVNLAEKLNNNANITLDIPA